MPLEKVPDEPPVLGAGILNGQTIKHFQGHLILQDCGVLMPEKNNPRWLKILKEHLKNPLEKVIPWTWFFTQHIFLNEITSSIISNSVGSFEDFSLSPLNSRHCESVAL